MRAEEDVTGLLVASRRGDANATASASGSSSSRRSGSAGFLPTIVTIRLSPVWVDRWGWERAYMPLAIGPALAPRPLYDGRGITFVVRVPGDPTVVVASARAAVASIDAGLPLANVRPMSEVVSISAGQPRFTTLVMSFVAGVAFCLAALGLYGVLAYSVEQRFREIGVPVARGAEKREIFQLIIANGMASHWSVLLSVFPQHWR